VNTKKQPIYDPSCDEEILSIGGSFNPKGFLMDIHETLYLSATNGFYLQRQIRQIRKGRTWETSELGECDEYPDSGNIRILKVLRPMSRTQVIRYVVDAYMPRQGGVHLATHLALDSAGIPSS
jgi:hypothetical protein